MKFYDEAVFEVYNDFSPEEIDAYVRAAMTDLTLYEGRTGPSPGTKLPRHVHPADAAVAYAMCMRYKSAPDTGALVWDGTNWISVASLVTSAPPNPKTAMVLGGVVDDMGSRPDVSGFSGLVESSLTEVDAVIGSEPAIIPEVLTKEYKVKDRPGKAPVWAKELMVALRFVGSCDLNGAVKTVASSPRTSIQVYHLAATLASEVLRNADKDAKVSDLLEEIDLFLGQASQVKSKDAIAQLSEMFK